MVTEHSKVSIIPALTGIRGIGAVWVMLYHLFPGNWLIIGQGYRGVDLFFILSGFILTHVHWKDFDRGYSLSKYRRFLLLRLARIYPLHITVLTAFAVAVVLLPGFTERYSRPDYFSASQLVATALLVQNWRMGTVSLWNDPAWSLSAEWLAYIFFPLAILTASNIGWGFKPLAATTALLAMFLVLAAAGHADGNSEGIVGLIRMAAEFLAGCLLSQFVMDGRSGTQPWQNVAWLSTLLIGIGFLFSSLPIFSYLGFAGLIASVAASDSPANRILGAKPIVFLGEISFSLYLVHWPLIQIRNWVSDSVAISMWFSSAALLPIIFIVSLGSWYYVERPGREIVRRLIDGKWTSSRAPG